MSILKKGNIFGRLSHPEKQHEDETGLENNVMDSPLIPSALTGSTSTAICLPSSLFCTMYSLPPPGNDLAFDVTSLTFAPIRVVQVTAMSPGSPPTYSYPSRSPMPGRGCPMTPSPSRMGIVLAASRFAAVGLIGEFTHLLDLRPVSERVWTAARKVSLYTLIYGCI